MKVLVIGSGAREHAITSALLADDSVTEVVVGSGAVVDEVIEIGAYQTVQGVSRITLAPEWGRGARAGFWRIPVTVE